MSRALSCEACVLLSSVGSPAASLPWAQRRMRTCSFAALLECTDVLGSLVILVFRAGVNLSLSIFLGDCSLPLFKLSGCVLGPRQKQNRCKTISCLSRAAWCCSQECRLLPG